ncbi:MAG: LPXTG cell wall anchor domain-containing protein [Clostridia bacterium]|nr:LPXTG cell wall anchor domain-containing protein [Clostridia bacterium]
MKKFTKLLGIVLIIALVMSMGAAALAEETTTTTNTITIGEAVDGETYTAYKLLSATYETADNTVTSTTPIAYYYTGAATDALYNLLVAQGFQFEAFQGNVAYLKVVDGEGNTIDYSTAVNAAALAKAINDAMNAETNPLTLTVAGSDTAENGTATIEVADKGYYFVNTSLGSVCSIDTAANVTINEKNTTTTQDKTVQEDSTGNYGDKNDASVGDTVNFQTTITIGKYQKNVVFHDVMQTEKLAFNASSVTVTGVPDGKYTIKTGENAATGDTFTVEFDNDWTSALAEDTTVTITYSAVLTVYAIVGDQFGLAMDAGNDNKSKVTYGDAQETTWDWTRTYTWQFDILKYTGTGSDKTPLAGAEFTLTQTQTVPAAEAGAEATTTTTTLTFVKVSDGDATNAVVYRYDPAGTVTTLVTPESGLIELRGLDADTYILTETKAPEGYNKLNDPITVVIDSNTDTDQGTGTDGKQADGSATIKKDGTSTDQVEVENNSGTVLPSTGGIGTTIFYVVGSILVVAAGVLLITKKRMSREG